jgi:VWFA-related protein
MPHIVPKSILVAGLGAVALSSALLAQSQERVLYATALDAKSKAPLESLSPSDLRITEDGRGREILRVTPATTPMSIAVVVDNQQAAQSTITDLRRALSSFATDVASLGPVAIVTTADRPTIVQDYTTDTGKLTQAANRLFAQPGSGATLLDAIVEVSRGIKRREEDRSAIVLVSTELTEFSNLHYSQVLDALRDSGAMMSGVVLTNQRGSNQTDPARNRSVVLDRGITDTGGTRVDVLTSISYSTALSQIAGALKHQYRVVYARPEQLIPPERIEASPVKDGVIISAAPARGQKER